MVRLLDKKIKIVGSRVQFLVWAGCFAFVLCRDEASKGWLGLRLMCSLNCLSSSGGKTAGQEGLGCRDQGSNPALGWTFFSKYYLLQAKFSFLTINWSPTFYSLEYEWYIPTVHTYAYIIIFKCNLNIIHLCFYIWLQYGHESYEYMISFICHFAIVLRRDQ